MNKKMALLFIVFFLCETTLFANEDSDSRYQKVPMDIEPTIKAGASPKAKSKVGKAKLAKPKQEKSNTQSQGMGADLSAFKTVQCDEGRLKRKICDLELSPYKISFTREKGTISDGVWKEVSDLPFKGEVAEWGRVQMSRYILGKRPRWIVEFEFWQKKVGEAELQDLIWIVYEVEGVKWKERIQEKIQKRRSNLTQKQPQWILDKKENFGIKISDTENGKLIWWSGRVKGDF